MSGKDQREHAKLSFLATYFGPSFLGVRNWLLISVLFLFCVALVGGLAVIPLSMLVFAAVIGLKSGALIAFLAGVGMGIKAVIDDYTEKAKNQKEYFWLPYLWGKLNKDFFEWLGSSPVNVVKFLFGFLLLAAVIGVLVCVCCPAVGIVIPGITAVVSFIGPAFEAVSLFAGSSIFTVAFLGMGMMLAYDVLCRVIETDDQVLADGTHEYRELSSVLESGKDNEEGEEADSEIVLSKTRRQAQFKGKKGRGPDEEPVSDDEIARLQL